MVAVVGIGSRWWYGFGLCVGMGCGAVLVCVLVWDVTWFWFVCWYGLWRGFGLCVGMGCDVVLA